MMSASEGHRECSLADHSNSINQSDANPSVIRPTRHRRANTISKTITDKLRSQPDKDQKSLESISSVELVLLLILLLAGPLDATDDGESKSVGLDIQNSRQPTRRSVEFEKTQAFRNDKSRPEGAGHAVDRCGSELSGRDARDMLMLRDYLNDARAQVIEEEGSGTAKPELPLSKDQLEVLRELRQHFNLNQTGGQSDETQIKSTASNDFERMQLPRPTNLSVLIISYYPPVLKLSWNLNALEPADAQKLDFYKSQASEKSREGETRKTDEKKSSHSANGSRNLNFDFELALETLDLNELANSTGELDVDRAGFIEHLRELQTRQSLVKKALTCFQVTYNIVNSRFKVIEEYPPYARSILLERLLPATEYNLRVRAVYLNGLFKRTSLRVRFISPTDNESRRFKENTYRPIHRFPDEKEELKVGLAHVRGEELALVAIAIFFWLATIGLFFNKWGKIRMLEPYQPAYREQVVVGGAPGSGVVVGSLIGNVAPSSGPPGSHQQTPPSGFGPDAGGATAATTAEFTCEQRLASVSGHNLHQLLGAQTSSATAASIASVQQQPTGHRMSASICINDQQHPPGSQLWRDSVGKSPEEAAAEAVALLRRKSSVMPLAASVGRRPAAGLPVRRAGTQESSSQSLFQAKASALAKASLMWPGFNSASVATAAHMAPAKGSLLSSQKLKQEKYKAKFESATAADLETLRRVGRCLAARRQFMKSCGASSCITQPANKFSGPLERLAAVAQTNRKLSSVFSTDHRAAGRQSSGALAFAWNTSKTSNESLEGAQAGVPLRTASLGAANPTDTHAQDSTTRPEHSTEGGTGGKPAARFIRRNQAIDFSSPRDSLRLGTQSMDHSHVYASDTSREALQQQAAPAAPPTGPVVDESAPSKSRRLQFLSHLHNHKRIVQSVSTSTLEQPPASFMAASKPSSLSSADEFTVGLHSASERARRRPRELSLQQQQRPPSVVLSESQCNADHHIFIEPPSPSNSNHKSSSPQARMQQSASLSAVDKRHSSVVASNVGARRTSGQSFLSSNKQQKLEQQHSYQLADQLKPSQSDTQLMQETPAPRTQRIATICGPQIRLQEVSPPASSTHSDAIPSSASSLQQQHEAEQWAQQRRRLDSDAFEKLAESYRASQERRLSRLASGRSLAQLASGPNHPSSNWAHCEHGPASSCACYDAGRPMSELEASHQSFGPETELQLGRARQRRCSHCHSPDCLGAQQAAQAVQQLRALQLRHTGAAALGALGAGDYELAFAACPACQTTASARRPRISSVFAQSPYARHSQHRDSFAMLRALSHKSKSAEDLAYLSSLVLQIWQQPARDPNPLLQSVSQLQAAVETSGNAAAERPLSGSVSLAGASRRSGSVGLAAKLAPCACARARRDTDCSHDQSQVQSRPHSAMSEQAASSSESASDQQQRRRAKSSLTVENL